jgi:hypothetical protein
MGAVVSTLDHDGVQAAELARRAGIEEGRSLAWVVTQWDLIAGDVCRDRCTAVINDLLDSATARTLLAEPGYPRLVRAIRGADMAGHDTTTILTDAVETRTLFGANSMSDVLRWRISIATAARIPEHTTSGGGWAAITPQWAGPVGEYLTALAAAADDRQHELGQRALAEQPAWATAHLGPPPVDELDRDEWVRRAGVIAAYRDLRVLPEDSVLLGPAPPREQVLHRALWGQAHTAAGAPTDQLDYATASESELRQVREAYGRELGFAPYWVHDELRDAQVAAAGHHQNAVLWGAEAQLLQPGTPERAHAEADVHSAQQLAAVYQARLEHLEVIDVARRQWHHDTETVRTQFDHAGNELTRRGLPRDLAPESSEQLPLLDVPATDPQAPTADSAHMQQRPETAAETGADAPAALTDEAQQAHLFTLEVDPRDVAATSALRESDDPAACAGRAPVTVADARHHAEVSTDLCAQHARWTAALERLERESVSDDDHHRQHDYLLRSNDVAEVDQEHSRDLDLGAEH